MTTRSNLACVTACLSLIACLPTNEQVTSEVAQAAITSGQIYGNSLPARTVVLTYDDGPDEHTVALAEYLAAEGIRATFFQNGRRFCQVFDAGGACMTPMETRVCDNGESQPAPAAPKHYPESLIDKLLALGHRVANHSQDHCNLQAQTNPANLAWEIESTHRLLEKHICDDVYLFRAPYGEWDAAAARRLQASPSLTRIVGPINWDVDGEDWSCWQEKVTPEACAAKYIKLLEGRANKNGILLMHDRPEFNVGYAGPLLMAKILVPKLKAAGYKFGSMDDVLKLTSKAGGSGCAAAPMDAGSSASEPADAGGDRVARATVDTGADSVSDGGVDLAPGTGGHAGSFGTGGDGAVLGNGGTGGAADPPGKGSSVGGSSSGAGSGGSVGGGVAPSTAGQSSGCGYGKSPANRGTSGYPVLSLLALGLARRRRVR